MTYKTDQTSVCASVRPCGVNIFKTLMLKDRWADVGETWHVYSVGCGRKLVGSEIWIYVPTPRGATSNLDRSG